MPSQRFQLTCSPGVVVDLPRSIRWPYVRSGDTFKRPKNLVGTGLIRIGEEEYQQELLGYSVDLDCVTELADRFGNYCAIAPTGDLPCTPEEIEAIRRAHVAGDLETFSSANEFSVLAATTSLRLLRALSRHWIAHKEGSSVRAAWESEGFPMKDDRRAWAVWTEWLNAQLRPIAMRVQVYDAEADQELGGPDVSYPTLVAMQISNAIAEDRPIFRCHSETCGRYFTRKQGGAKAGQHWTQNVKYCDKRCADAQAQRERRRRVKLEQQAPSDQDPN